MFDVAQCILERLGPIPAVKLQKLVYYCQAWALVWDGRPIFNEKIEAWANGPVVRELYNEHKGLYEVSKIKKGNPAAISAEHTETINIVLDARGDKSPQWLGDLSHFERPWRDARNGLAPGERSRNEITLSAMAEYYESLLPDSDTS